MGQGKRVAVVDGNNVAYDEPDRKHHPRLENLLRMHKALEHAGYRPITIVDASLRYEIDDPKRLDKLENAGTIRQAPAGTPADYFVLESAEHEDGVVVSNDIFREWREERPWLQHRRMPFMIIDGTVHLYLDDLDPKYVPRGEA